MVILLIILATNDHGYVLFVVITIRGTFLVHDVSPGLKQEWHDGWHYRNRKFISFKKTRLHPRFCNKLLNLYFSV